MNRRRFLKTSAAAALGLSAVGLNNRVLGANDKIRIGIIGVGIKGRLHAHHLLKIPGAQLVALADPDPAYHMNTLRDKLANGETPVKVETYTDFRKLLDRKDIDAVIIASPNHWHALHTIYALRAGKHVYVEKPASHDIWQGRQMVNLAKKSGLVVQAGLHHRSRNCWPEVMEYLKEGHLGKILCARALCYKRRKSIGRLDAPLSPPASCDYDLWLGPAQDEPIFRPQFHYDWHWVWNTGDGDLGNQGVHQLDIARWLIGQTKYPEKVVSIGGRFGYEDAGQTPNTQIIFYDYKPIPLLFEVRGLPVRPDINAMPVYKKTRIGTIIECEGGYVSEEAAYDNQGKRIHKFTGHGGENHLPRFLEAVRNNRPRAAACSIADGHLSTAMCHMGNISHRIGQTASPADIAGMIRSDTLKGDTWRRMLEHVVINGVDLNKNKATLGPVLSFDGTTEQFTGTMAEQANALLKREYRKGWNVPEII
ncbi:MAG: Gfo/Idh/MocA family oxidoreductase [Planctomycetota bacterium]